MAELSSNRTGGNSVQDETENEKFTVMWSRTTQNLEFGHFMLSVWPSTAKKCTKIYNGRPGPLIFSLNLFCDVLVAVVVVA